MTKKDKAKLRRLIRESRDLIGEAYDILAGSKDLDDRDMLAALDTSLIYIRDAQDYLVPGDGD